MSAVRVRIRVEGVVQGVGFRPFVHARATEAGLTGHVGNDGSGVVIEAQGERDDVDRLIRAIREQAPPLAVVDAVHVEEVVRNEGDAGFRIAASGTAAGVTSVPPDTAVCEDCLREMRDPSDRRHGYAFIACTNCGPRFTIATGLPYDRERTTMADFPLCASCREEYEDPGSRRFHAQPTACPACGPELTVAVHDIAEALNRGDIVAIKGVGGYHLACDARNAEAVDRLRARKGRGSKPFALMARDLDEAAGVLALDDPIRRALTSSARPIVLAPSSDPELQGSVAPGNIVLGVMLPYAPVHHLLFDAGAPSLLVMTSGNRSDEPICTDAEDAEARLSDIADLFVHHDRRIHVACDDSVLRIVLGEQQPVRRSRGFAPLPVALPIAAGALAAVGGELKATVAVALGRRAWLSQHIGDVESVEGVTMLARTLETLGLLQGIEPEALVSDLHPGYLSHRFAREEARRRGIAHLGVQHHHAHMGALLAEHGIREDDSLVFAFDGTGFGLDGTIWGGEVLLGGLRAAERVGHLASMRLPGGDAAVRHPARTALAYLHDIGIEWSTGMPPVEALSASERRLLASMLAAGTQCVPTTSAGRLFDAVSAVLGVRERVDYEGQAAIELEALAATASAEPWPVSVADRDGVLVIDARPLLLAAVADAASGRPLAESARAFHEGLAAAVAEVASRMAERATVGRVGLTGGVFANAVLTQAAQGRLASLGFEVLVHRLVPPNDGGLPLGQVAVAAAGGARVMTPGA